jgi:hypothetical protein
MGSILPCCLPYGNAGGLQILRCQGFEVKYYDFTLDALTLKPSDVCNVGVKYEQYRQDFVVGILMKQFVIPFFIVLGALDFLYGVIFGDKISMLAGAAIVAITFYILKTKK